MGERHYQNKPWRQLCERQRAIARRGRRAAWRKYEFLPAADRALGTGDNGFAIRDDALRRGLV
ncbi:hypothetical protein D4N06_04415 [Klebsiella pneumoniae]|uniref:Uncharacterized protein n=2 Tax=Klebsiella pneumoniae TaxID=573 RepID=A0AAX2B0I3_KLEPN|nr:hypothetical protein AM385_11715 [Klebsiella pneumoniae]AWX84047.1 hypothetical protein DQB71_23000 [Klebsiella pneumoniae subsp. pneumoniae]NBI26263.1 hypothetical protein [Klebsiella quasipneumoniae]TBO79647.1 hypothetical protein EXT85_02250 [Klebsiella quasipneumoniae subsp. similipneumoniae]TYC80579.1 hypothetical protein E4M18_012085 [Klebsiella sp. Z2]HBY9175036.1 hypothetical protein [Klebsiella pneumoniae MGH 78578]